MGITAMELWMKRDIELDFGNETTNLGQNEIPLRNICHLCNNLNLDHEPDSTLGHTKLLSPTTPMHSCLSQCKQLVYIGQFWYLFL